MNWMTRLTADPLRTLFLFADGEGDGGGEGDGDPGKGDGDGAAGEGDGGGKGEGEGEGSGGEGDSLLGGKPDDNSGEGDGGSKDGSAASNAPESYAEFKVPEGVSVSESQLEAATPVFKDLGLSQEAAQKLVDLQVKNFQDQQAAWVETSKQWQDELKKDPDIGGAAFNDNVERARALVDRVLGKEDAQDLRELFQQGYGNFPPLFRFVVRLANAVSEDSFGGRSTPDKATRSEKDKLMEAYPTMFDKDGNAKKAG